MGGDGCSIHVVSGDGCSMNVVSGDDRSMHVVSGGSCGEHQPNSDSQPPRLFFVFMVHPGVGILVGVRP